MVSSSSVRVGVYTCVHMCAYTRMCVLCTYRHECACVHVHTCAHMCVLTCRFWLAWVEGATAQFGFVSALVICSRCYQSGTKFLLIPGLEVCKPCRQFILEPEPPGGQTVL